MPRKGETLPPRATYPCAGCKVELPPDAFALMAQGWLADDGTRRQRLCKDCHAKGKVRWRRDPAVKAREAEVFAAWAQSNPARRAAINGLNDGLPGTCPVVRCLLA